MRDFSSVALSNGGDEGGSRNRLPKRGLKGLPRAAFGLCDSPIALRV